MQPLIVPKEVFDFEDAISWLLEHERYKGKINEIIKINQSSKKGLLTGICHGMALIWIRGNNKQIEMNEFHNEIMGSEWKVFKTAQEDIVNKKVALQSLLSKKMGELKAFTKYAEQVGHNDNKDFIMRIKKLFTFSIENEIGDKIRDEYNNDPVAYVMEINREVASISEKIKNEYKIFVYGHPGMGKITTLFSKKPLFDIVPSLKNELYKTPAYYLINMNFSSIEKTGHSIAIYANINHYKLLDANTSELKFDTANTLFDFLIDYMQIYIKFGYANSQAEMIKFETVPRI